jgi:hypothetical protein
LLLAGILAFATMRRRRRATFWRTIRTIGEYGWSTNISFDKYK